MIARIYQPAQNAMQSGRKSSKNWRLEFEREVARTTDPLMGYTSSKDTQQQVALSFDTVDDAIAYAKRHNIAYKVQDVKKRKITTAAYSDNFKTSRRIAWTH